MRNNTFTTDCESNAHNIFGFPMNNAYYNEILIGNIEIKLVPDWKNIRICAQYDTEKRNF